MTNASSENFLGDPAGQEFGPYTIVRRLGVGGMAETFEAVRHGPGDFTQRVCLKLVLPFFRGNEDFNSAFEREARLVARLRHSNIVGVIDFGHIEQVSYMALELVDGVDLAALLDAQQGGRLPHDCVALLGYELAAALEHAHDPHRDGQTLGPRVEAIIHRDVSPSNVLISHRGEVLLTDFGVAKAVTGASRQQSAIKGKVPYMSPEHLRAHSLDGRADLFSLGVVLYEALAGRRPFEGGNDPATILMILNGERPSLRSAAPNTPPELCEVVERLLHPDREARPESASELRDLLHPFLPPPRVSRELGRMTSKVRRSLHPPPSKPTSGVSRSSDALAPTVRSSRPEDRQSTSTPKPTRRSWAWLLAVLLCAGALLWWRQDDARPPATEGAPAAETTANDEVSTAEDAPATVAQPLDPASSETVESAREVEPAGAQPADAAAQKQSAPPASARPARLSVFVFPWGEVWINGKSRGSAPLEDVTLKPGRYKVSVGRGEPTKTRVVRLRSGQRKSLQFELTD